MITGLFAGVFTLFFIFLSALVITGRGKAQTALGAGKCIDLERRIRAHGNFSEYTPIFLITLGIGEVTGLSEIFIFSTGCAFTLGRALHAFSLLKGEKYENDTLKSGLKIRVAGMVLTFLSLATAAVGTLSVNI